MTKTFEQLEDPNHKQAVDALEAIAQALDGTRNRFGKFERRDPQQGEPLRKLAVKYQVAPAEDLIEQAHLVARAVLRAVHR